MEEDGFEEWDDDFVEKLDQIEKLAIAATQQRTNSITPPPSTTTLPLPQQPVRLGYAHEPSNTTTHSPPRELSQRPVAVKNIELRTRRSDFKPVVSSSKNCVVASSRNASIGTVSAPAASSSRRAENTEVIRLKRELERVSKQLTQREQECLELKKERERKEVQLQSGTLAKGARGSQARSLRDPTVPSEECVGVSGRWLDQNVSNNQGSSQFGIGISSYHTKGVQTEVEIDDFPLPSDTETTSCDFLVKKLKAIQRCSADFYSGSYLASKLFVVCDTELQVLFGYCKTTSYSELMGAVGEENRSRAPSVDTDKLICSSDAANLSRFYNAVTRMSSGMVKFETFFKALLDLCLVQNAVIINRSLRVLHVVLLHFAGFQQTSTRRDNCAIEAANDVSALSGMDNIGIACHKHLDADALHASDTKLSCIEWLSLFQLMHQISNSVTDEPILYEAICIMNVILKRFGPSDRERFGQLPVFQTVPKLLKKDAGLRVEKEAVHLLYLLVNCSSVLASLYFVSKEAKSNSHVDNNGSTFEGLPAIFTGLEDCLLCSGTNLEALELRRSAITLVSYLVSFGSSGHEVLWSSTACNKTGFLLLIFRLLAFEVDSEALNPGELTNIVKQRLAQLPFSSSLWYMSSNLRKKNILGRTLLVREALIFLNRIISHPTFSGPALRALTTGRETANFTVDTISRLSRKGRSIWQDDGITKQTLENEIPNLARLLYKRVCAFLGDNISL